MKTGLIEKLEKLPDSLQKEVEDFMDFLIYKDQQKEKDSNSSSTNSLIRNSGFGSGKGIFGKMPDDFDKPLEEKPKLKREFGGLKGLVTYMADDFDAPLEDFKDYM
ncbi:DUF2281 domain-containing protein [uncultured Mucilaginibacter sp.]|uniref:type II toxin-antitoxin system VapB family antitoxin n=1 Tax=uncultured Mucilaginibacter sp. TaxID=797541 RepID=UPI00261A887C|nr:DUF2281 domain-containing protein [uncultured Mucilaginibacter sp.]